MSWLDRVATGLGTVIGVLAEKAAEVVASVRQGYERYRDRGGATRDAAEIERGRRADTLKDINEGLVDLRRKIIEGRAGDAETRRWNDLREQRAELMRELEEAKEVKAAETILDGADGINKVVIEDANIHIITANAFADVVNKSSSMCGRKMKLQWPRNIEAPATGNLFWGCTGWYFPDRVGNRRCQHTELLSENERALMVDTTLPEFQTSNQDFNEILIVPDVRNIIIERVDDLAADLRAERKGVEVATCPVHGEALILKKKTGAARGLLDMYYLRCPYWLPENQGCPFVEKLKSPSQLAVLLKSETGAGIL